MSLVQTNKATSELSEVQNCHVDLSKRLQPQPQVQMGIVKKNDMFAFVCNVHALLCASVH